MFLLCLFFWITLNGRVTVEIILFGVVISALMYLFTCRFMGYSVRRDIRLMRQLPWMFVYVCALVLEIILATNTMLQYLLAPAKTPEPAIIHFHSHLKSPRARMLLANAITLTPGTLTVHLVEDDFSVYCYKKCMGGGIENTRIYRFPVALLLIFMIIFLLWTVNWLPAFGDPGAPENNEAAQRYIEKGLEKTEAVNIVAGMILDYRALDTFGYTIFCL